MPDAPLAPHGYGAWPDLPDQRDYLFAAEAPPASLPPLFDLEPEFPAVYDQGQANSCVGNGWGAVLAFLETKEGLSNPIEPSRLFLYYQARLMEGGPMQDTGAMVRDGIKAAASYGYCPEADWPYNLDRVNQQPFAQAYTDAQEHRALEYRRVPLDIVQVQACIASGYPVVLGMSVYQSFESEEAARTGVVPHPGLNEQVIAGHCVVACGYDTTGTHAPPGNWVKHRNSWGAEWGQNGYFWLPFSYYMDGLVSDLWTARTTS